MAGWIAHRFDSIFRHSREGGNPAGGEDGVDARELGYLYIPRLCGYSLLRNWIPAFAGMTEVSESSDWRSRAVPAVPN
ncbi:MAG: hypothetical protein JWP89_4513 [Schlesneria sp.]|nr:hypothetical protein [Schlesneria sp.]